MSDRVRAVAAEERVEMLIDSVKDYAIFMLDPQGNVQTWNTGAERLKQYSPEDIIGKHFSVFYPPEMVAERKPWRLLEIAEREGRVEDEGWRIRKDGTRFWADVVISAVRDPSGQLVGFSKVTRDLTERRAAMQELQRSEEHFRLLVESVKDYAIFMVDPKGIIQTWNDGAARIKGYTAHEAIGRHISMFYPPEDALAGKPQRLLELARREGRVEDEGLRVRKDGTRFWADVVLTALRDANGELVGYTKVTRDLTERRQAEQERLRLAQSQEAVRLRDEFLSIASHELKTPLTALTLQLQAARRGVDGLPASRLDRAVRSADRLTELIETLLDVSRIASGKLSINPKKSDLGEIAHEAVDRMQPSAAHAGVPLTLRTGGPLPGRWDALRMGQVIGNLVSNALKYGNGSPVEVTLRPEDRQAVLEVCDRGPGIPPQDIDRIFGRFERAAPALNYSGLGLGLYVTRQIVEAHGGKIAAENRSGGGARFIVRLPADPQPAAAAAEGMH